jgi:hypothetical protein
MEPPQIPTNSSTVLNKIIIPVITTVLGATAIYFLGFNKRPGQAERTDMEQMLMSKEATVKAWKSYATAINISYGNGKSLGEQFGQKTTEAAKQGFEGLVPVWKEFENEFARESKKYINDVEMILKEKDVDRDFISMLNRGLDNQKDADKKMHAFFEKVTSIANSPDDDNVKLQKLQAESIRYMEDSKKDNERMVREAEGISKILMDRYSQAFNLNELEVYVDYKKEKDKKTDDPVTNTPANPAPKDPANPTGTEVKANIPPADKGTGGGSGAESVQTVNSIQPTKSLLTGTWSMTGGELELTEDGDMMWLFTGKGYTSGDWNLVNGKLQMNATNPDTGQSFFLDGILSKVTRSSFTLTLNSSGMQGSYNFVKRRS